LLIFDPYTRTRRAFLKHSGKMVTPARKLFPSVTDRHIFALLTSHSILGSSGLREARFGR